MCIIRTTFTHLGLNGHLNGDIHSVPKGMVKRGCVVFAHGYKGFKDWGAWGMMGDMFAEEGFGKAWPSPLEIYRVVLGWGWVEIGADKHYG